MLRCGCLDEYVDLSMMLLSHPHRYCQDVRSSEKGVMWCEYGDRGNRVCRFCSLPRKDTEMNGFADKEEIVGPVPYTQTCKKEKWIDGPWSSEPDLRTGEYRGMHWCAMRHLREGHWCGYVGFDLGHAFCKSTQWGYPGFEGIHEGINYDCRGEDGALHWLGFSCSGAEDVTPMRATIADFLTQGPNYRGLIYVVDTCRRLIDQLHKQWPEGEAKP